MKLVDYTGRINNHDEYLEILNKLKKKSKYIEYVLVDENDIEFINTFKSLIMSMTYKNKWWGTKIRGKGRPVYKIRSSKEIFQYLNKFETFCKFNISIYGDIAESTNFGTNDIAFFDEQEKPLLFTTTHEGYITIRNDLFS